MSYLEDAFGLWALGGEDLIVTLGAWFDDAGSHRDTKVIVWGGFIGTKDNWIKLDPPWRERLARPFDKPEHARPALKRFHLAPCEHRFGEFSGWSEAESAALQRSFREIIAQSGIVGVAFAIDKVAFDQIVTGDALEFFGDAESLVFGSCFRGALDQASKYFPDELTMRLVFDKVAHRGRMDRLTDLAERYMDFDRAFGKLPVVSGYSFEDSTRFTPLQAADVIATENYWAAQHYISTNESSSFRPHFEDFLQMVFAEGNIMRAPEIRATLQRYGFTPAA